MFVGEVSPVLAQSRQQRHLRRLHSNVPQRRGQLCLPGPGDDSNSHTGKHTNTQRGTHRSGEGRWRGERKRDNRSRLARSNHRAGTSVSGKGRAADGPRGGVLPWWPVWAVLFLDPALLHAGHVLGSGCHDNPPPNHPSQSHCWNRENRGTKQREVGRRELKRRV